MRSTLLKKLAADPYPRVRLEAVRAASFFPVAEAVEVALISAEHPTDEYLDYTRGETMKTLEPYWKKAIAEGRPIAFTSEAGARFFLGRLSTDELLKMTRTRAVDLELLFRQGVRDEIRREALADLAKRDKKPELRGPARSHQGPGRPPRRGQRSVAFDLVRLLTGREPAELADGPGRPGRAGDAGRKPVTRQLGYVALIAADGGVDKAWTLARKSAGRSGTWSTPCR